MIQVKYQIFILMIISQCSCMFQLSFIRLFSWNWLQGYKRETRFTSRRPADEIISKIEQAVKPLGYDVKTKNYKVMLIFSVCLE